LIPELQQITDQIDLPLYDIVTGSNFSPQNFDEKETTSIEILDFESICDSDVTTVCQSPDSEYLSSSGQDDFLMESIPFLNDDQYIQDCQLNSSPYAACEKTSPNLKEDNHHSHQNYSLSFNDSSIDKCESNPNFNIHQDDFQLVDEIIETKTPYSWSINSSSPQSKISEHLYYSIDEEPIKKHYRLKGVTKKRSRYSRNPEEKKSRKKEQNKNAATRYRRKKKEEIHVIVDEERGLLDRNRKLSNIYKVSYSL
jgi:hypothetical protein